ncbi:hypothetical protein Poly59_37920 [Rubripirellula reticaptiva]|uniref:Uncharacterized protein n=1 Tax=Rubripirellula reticaptiva TaxID=2528013 RepID=A0A5C6EK36_9BACT|nr:hypothetical protein Poly59_37920 [Rubripirellula reticaptiva]
MVRTEQFTIEVQVTITMVSEPSWSTDDTIGMRNPGGRVRNCVTLFNSGSMHWFGTMLAISEVTKKRGGTESRERLGFYAASVRAVHNAWIWR